jgi:hypothetical protein
MIKRLLIAVALLCASLAYGQSVKPLVSPHYYFLDASGQACAGCSLGTFAAGTTTPLATYTDSSGLVVNTNPIILDAAGGANIWVGAPSLKLVLKDALGSEIWTVDNIPAGSSNTVCGPAYTIQFANSGATGFACDPQITINPLIHTINVGGPLPASHFSLTNLNPVVSGWTLDVTTKGTAALSIGLGSPAAGKYIDGASGTWTTLPGASGTVTSVAATATGAPLSVTGSPITTSGTLAYTLAVTGTGAKAVTAASTPTDGCGQYVSGDLTSTGSACATNPTFTGGSGYQLLPSGLTLEWGTTPTFDTGPVTVTFPLAFAHACLMKPMLTQDLNVSVTTRLWESGSCTTTNFVVRNDGNGAATYFVIGW